ncbi:hypothetical protein GOODEAATRI_008940, partial [Goodea atripinnis]
AGNEPDSRRSYAHPAGDATKLRRKTDHNNNAGPRTVIVTKCFKGMNTFGRH